MKLTRKVIYSSLLQRVYNTTNQNFRMFENINKEIIRGKWSVILIKPVLKKMRCQNILNDITKIPCKRVGYPGKLLM